MKKLNVVFTIDEKYILYFTVACTSLLETNSNLGEIFLVHDIQNSENLKQSIAYFKKVYNVDIKELSLDSTVLENYRISHHFSKAVYFRLLLADILPAHIEEILFLDSDIIINDDLSEILKINFEKEDYYIFACDHKYSEDGLIRFKKFDFKGNRYFNSGVMYINLKKWRKENTSKTLILNYERYKEDLIFWDQDILNITFDEKWGKLDYVYNAFGLTKQNNDGTYKIIHYTGTTKPWHLGSNHPYKYLYWKYQNMTPFKRYLPEGLTVRNAIKWMMPDTLRNFIKN